MNKIIGNFSSGEEWEEDSIDVYLLASQIHGLDVSQVEIIE